MLITITVIVFAVAVVGSLLTVVFLPAQRNIPAQSWDGYEVTTLHANGAVRTRREGQPVVSTAETTTAPAKRRRVRMVQHRTMVRRLRDQERSHALTLRQALNQQHLELQQRLANRDAEWSMTLACLIVLSQQRPVEGRRAVGSASRVEVAG